MAVMRRVPVSKSKGAKRFRHDVKRTKAPNVAAGPMRGGWRL